MELMCIFCPAFISLMINYKLNGGKLKTINMIAYYFLSVLSINVVILIISKLIFKLYAYLFTINFSLKYLLLSVALAIIIPYITNISKTKKIIIDIKKNPKKYVECIKKFFLKHSFIISRLVFIVLLVGIFWSFDYFLRSKLFTISSFYLVGELSPNLFSIVYALGLAIFLIYLPKIVSRIILVLMYLFSLVLFFTHYMLIAIRGQAFTVYDLANTSEGMEYLNFLKKEISSSLVLIIIISLVAFIIAIKIIKFVNKKTSWKKLILVIVLLFVYLVLGRSYAINSLGSYNEEDWSKHVNPRYYYDTFINPIRSLQTSGLYEYTIKDLYLYLKNSNESYGSPEEIDKISAEIKIIEDTNDKTGIFKDKNLIMIMMESIDNLAINEEVMPTLYYMRNNGWNFTGRNSDNIATSATEFVSLSGLYFLGDSYAINNNYYQYSLPSVFRSNGYGATSVHENRGIYYNRTQLHKALGFDNSYFLYDILDNPLYGNDQQIIENDEIYNAIIPKNGEKFMNAIITISAHGPYVNNPYCNNEYVEEGNETSCLNYLSNLTDQMLESLLRRLEEDGLLEDTVIVLYSDHYPYAYTFSDEQLASMSNIDGNNRIRNLPFIIYNSEIEPEDYEVLFSDIDIVPTLLNLFGIEYNSRNYVGTDIFSPNHKDMNIFANYSWYDGVYYSGNSYDNYDEYFADTSKYVQKVIDLNKMMISNNYYGS